MKKEFQKFWVSQPVIWIKDKKCLILESAKRPGFYGLPGGRIDENEEAEVALKRELKEEINVDNFEKLGIVDYLVHYTNSSGQPFDNPLCAVITLIESDQSVDNSDLVEHSSFVWVSEDQISDYKYVWQNLDKIIKRAFTIHKNLNK